MATPLVLVADDLSGAAELAALAAARGLSAEVHRHPQGAWQADVIALDADARGLDAAEAAQRWQRLAAEVMRRRPAALYLKVDSVLRGHPHIQVASFLQASGRKRAVLVPANPSHGRRIVGGQYTIHGQPLEESALARDPQYPRTTSDLAQLLAGTGARILRRPVRSAADLASLGILVPDAASAEDLQALAALVDETTLAAGAADFFAALLEARGFAPANAAAAPATPVLRPPALLVCGSPTGWRLRARQCEAAGLAVCVWHETPAEDRGGNFSPLVPAEAAAVAARIPTSGNAVLALGDPQVPLPQAEAMLQRFCQVSAQVVALVQPSSLLVEGGATAGLLVAALGWHSFRVLPQTSSSVGLLVPCDPARPPFPEQTGDALPAPQLWIKPGSYAWPDEVWKGLVGAGGARASVGPCSQDRPASRQAPA